MSVVLLYTSEYMQQIVTITSKFQVHIPKAIREKAGILTHGPVVMRADAGKVTITSRKIGSILDLAGKYRAQGKVKKIDVANIRDVIDYSDL